MRTFIGKVNAKAMLWKRLSGNCRQKSKRDRTEGLLDGFEKILSNTLMFLHSFSRRAPSEFVRVHSYGADSDFCDLA